MWLQLALHRTGSARRPFKNLTSLDLSSSSCGFVVLSAKLWGCHLPKSTNQPWTVSMRGNLHTPWGAVAAVSLQKCYKPWAVMVLYVVLSLEVLSLSAFAYVYQQGLGGQHAGVNCTNCTPPGTQWSRWVCRNVTSLGLSPSSYDFVRRTLARSFEPVSIFLSLPTRLGRSVCGGN